MVHSIYPILHRSALLKCTSSGADVRAFRAHPCENLRDQRASVREPDALIGHVRFAERDVETEHGLLLRHWQSKEPAPAMQT